jgi:hypothetical protein
MGHVAWLEEMIKAYKISVRKLQGKRSLVRPKNR